MQLEKFRLFARNLDMHRILTIEIEFGLGPEFIISLNFGLWAF